MSKRSGLLRNIAMALLIAALMTMVWTICISGVNVYGASSKKASRPARPQIRSLTAAEKSFTVRAGKYSKIRGFQIKVSGSRTFSGSKVYTLRGKSLKKSFYHLKGGKKYYVKIRTYKLVKGKRVYSKWSKWKSVRTKKYKKRYVYVARPWITLHTSKSLSSSYDYAWYNQKLYLTDRDVYSNGIWYRVRYGGRTCYMWTSRNTTVITGTRSKLKYTGETVYEKDVIRMAMDIYYNYPTKYDNSHHFPAGVKDSDGLYPFDCSILSAYIINTVMQKYCPAYRLHTDDDEQYKVDNLLNEGMPGELNATIICRGKPDYDLLRPGDLLFFGRTSNESDPIRHVGIYLGNGEFLHSIPLYAKTPRRYIGGVNIMPLKDKYSREFVYAKRVLPEELTPVDILMQTNTGAGFYSAATCRSSERICYIGKGSQVTVMWTVFKRNTLGYHTKVAYVSWTDKTGTVREGFVLYRNLTEPDPVIDEDPAATPETGTDDGETAPDSSGQNGSDTSGQTDPDTGSSGTSPDPSSGSGTDTSADPSSGGSDASGSQTDSGAQGSGDTSGPASPEISGTADAANAAVSDPSAAADPESSRMVIAEDTADQQSSHASADEITDADLD